MKKTLVVTLNGITTGERVSKSSRLSKTDIDESEISV